MGNGEGGGLGKGGRGEVWDLLNGMEYPRGPRRVRHDCAAFDDIRWAQVSDLFE
jgi:hypothetical protein